MMEQKSVGKHAMPIKDNIAIVCDVVTARYRYKC
jgi:hypothetical protein